MKLSPPPWMLQARASLWAVHSAGAPGADSLMTNTKPGAVNMDLPAQESSAYSEGETPL